MQWLSLSLCESGAKYYLEETSCTCFPKWMSPSNNTNLCLVMFGSSASSMNSGIPGIPLFVKDTTVIILNASSLDLLSGDFPAFSGDQTFTYGNLVGGCILHCDLKRCWTRKHTHCIDLYNINLYRIYEYVSIYHIVLSFWHKLFHFCSRMYACRHSWYSVGNGQFGLEGSEFLRLLGGSRHPFEQGCVRPAPSLKSGDDWMIDVFLGWSFEVENS